MASISLGEVKLAIQVLIPEYLSKSLKDNLGNIIELKKIDIYKSLEKPLFVAADIMSIIGKTIRFEGTYIDHVHKKKMTVPRNGRMMEVIALTLQGFILAFATTGHSVGLDFINFVTAAIRPNLSAELEILKVNNLKLKEETSALKEEIKNMDYHGSVAMVKICNLEKNLEKLLCANPIEHLGTSIEYQEMYQIILQRYGLPVHILVQSDDELDETTIGIFSFASNRAKKEEKKEIKIRKRKVATVYLHPKQSKAVLIAACTERELNYVVDEVVSPKYFETTLQMLQMIARDLFLNYLKDELNPLALY